MAPDPPLLSANVRPSDGGAVVTFAGELDLATAEVFARTVREQLVKGPVLLDLGALSFMDSSGVTALDRLLRDAESNGWTLTLTPDLRPTVRRVLEVTGMMDVLPVQHEEGSGMDREGSSDRRT